MKIFVFYGLEPVLNISVCTNDGPNKGKKYGLHRDRYPDSGWSELRNSFMDHRCTEIELTDELKVRLLEDLAYAYGGDTPKFGAKLKEFNLI